MINISRPEYIKILDGQVLRINSFNVCITRPNFTEQRSSGGNEWVGGERW